MVCHNKKRVMVVSTYHTDKMQVSLSSKMDLEEVGRGCGDWMELAQDRKRWRALVSTVMNLQVP